MIKQTLSLACAALLVLAGSAQAQTATIGGIEYTVNADGQAAAATGYTGNPADVAIPATVNIDGTDYPVTAIGDFAFTYCTALESIILPESLQSIGETAFWGCTALQSIDLPEGLQTTGEGAFGDCTALQSITLPESLQSIDTSAFNGCTALQSITLPESLQSIGNSAFNGCTALQSITLPEGLQTIGSYAFGSCYALQSATLPEGLQSIDGGTFYDCTALQNFTFPEKLKSIGDYAFNGCTALESITLPSTLQTISEEAFNGCHLNEIICHAVTPPSIYEATFDYDTYATATLTVPAEAEDAYSVAKGWEMFYTSILENGIIYSVRKGKQGATVLDADLGITAAAIPATVSINGTDYPVTAIDSYAFQSCSALQSVTLPEGLQTIGIYAFNDCDALQSITFPKGLQSIGSSAFSNCSALQSVTFPEGLQSIGIYAFSGCWLTDIHVYAAIPPAIYEDTFGTDTYTTATLHVPSNVTSDYQAAQWWELFQYIVGDLPPVSITDVAADASLATYANGILTTESPASITVHTQSGAMVRHAAAATSLSLAGLPSGLYIICIEMEGQRQVMKVVR